MNSKLLLHVAALILVCAGLSSAEGLFNGPEGVVFDTTHNRYLVANWNDATIVEIDSTGAESYFWTGSIRISGLLTVGDTLYGAGQNGVLGLDLETAAVLSYVSFSGSQLLNAMTLDTSGYMYITDAQPSRIYRYDLSSNTYTIFHGGLIMPVGILFDPEANRLLVTTRPDNQASIHEVDLVDLSDREIVATGLPVFGYLEEYENGEYLATCHPLGHIYLFDHEFTDSPRLISQYHSSPTQIFYNRLDSMLVVPNYTGNSVDFVKMSDVDGDWVLDIYDNCPETPNSDQTNNDTDSLGNVCDNCPDVGNADQANDDTDGLGDVCDNCPSVTNPGQEDVNGNLTGDACEACCGFWSGGYTGNVNGSTDGNTTLSDITMVVDFVYISKEPPECPESANANGSVDGMVTLSDIARMIDHVYVSKDPPELCL